MIYLNRQGRSVNLAWLPKLERIIRRRFKANKDISLALVSDKEIRSLNKVYRHRDRVTDVLSFPWEDRGFLGEVLICLNQARRQARQYKHSLTKEMKILTIHGVLHLLGFDHERNLEEFKRQCAEEEKILKLLD